MNKLRNSLINNITFNLISIKIDTLISTEIEKIYKNEKNKLQNKFD